MTHLGAVHGTDAFDAPERVGTAETSVSAPEPRSEALSGALVGVAALVAAFAEAAPTGIGWWNVVLRMVLAGAFTASVAVAPRWVGGCVAVVAATFAGASGWIFVAFAAFGVAAAGLFLDRGHRAISALTGALSIQVLLRFEPVGFFGLPSIIAAVVVVPVLLFGYRALPVGVRARLLRIGLGVLLVGSALVFVASLTAVSVRDEAEQGIGAARRALAAARAGDTALLATELGDAERLLGHVDDRLGNVLVQPLRLVPVLSQHHDALTTASRHGAQAAAEASAAATEADIGQLRLIQGRFDLDLLAAMAPRLRSTAGLLSEAGDEIEAARSPWLLPQLDDRLGSLAGEIAELSPEAELAVEAATVLPGMLGGDGARRYIVLVGQPGEAREFGGFVGGYALIEVIDGGLELVDAGSAPEMRSIGVATRLDHPGGYPTEFAAADPVVFPQNFTSTPDLGVVLRAVRDVYPDFAGAPIDGVVYADAYALAAMLEFTAPIMIPGLDAPLDSRSLAQFFFVDQYRVFPDKAERLAIIEAVLEATFERLAGSDLPGPERLGEVLGPAARGGRLQVMTVDDAENAFLARVKLQRRFNAPDGVDALALIHANSTASKLDVYLTRELDHRVRVDADGSLAATSTITLRSTVPDDAPAYTLAANSESPRTNVVLLSLYSPHDVVEVTVDGRAHEFVVQQEFGFNRYALFEVPVPDGQAVVVKIDLEGRADPDGYALALWHQPLVNADLVRVEYAGPRGLRRQFSLELAENVTMEFTN